MAFNSKESMDAKAQISIEFMVVLAVLIGFALFILSNVMETGAQWTNTFESKSQGLLSELEKYQPKA
jgi:hypothetical protein